MKNRSIIEWEKIQNNANYQTKFIAGETNFDKAVEILEQKMSWVGLTEENADSLCSFKQHFGLKNFYYDTQGTNASLADKKEKEKVQKKFGDFINEQNQIDIRLYNYVKNNLWPRFKVENIDECKERSGKMKPIRDFNMLMFQLQRQTKVRNTNLNLKNLNRFYTRWFKK
jgi:hypothetical protein